MGNFSLSSFYPAKKCCKQPFRRKRFASDTKHSGKTTPAFVARLLVASLTTVGYNAASARCSSNKRQTSAAFCLCKNVREMFLCFIELVPLILRVTRARVHLFVQLTVVPP